MSCVNPVRSIVFVDMDVVVHLIHIILLYTRFWSLLLLAWLELGITCLHACMRPIPFPLKTAPPWASVTVIDRSIIMHQHTTTADNIYFEDEQTTVFIFFLQLNKQPACCSWMYHLAIISTSHHNNYCIIYIGCTAAAVGRCRVNLSAPKYNGGSTRWHRLSIYRK